MSVGGSPSWEIDFQIRVHALNGNPVTFSVEEAEHFQKQLTDALASIEHHVEVLRSGQAEGRNPGSP